MGPKIYSTQKGETKYSVRLLPLGGYVSMEGEDGEPNDPRAFGEKTTSSKSKHNICRAIFQYNINNITSYTSTSIHGNSK